MVRPNYLEFIGQGGNEIYHFGTKEHSGRYPWGSGDRPKQRLEKAKNKHLTKERKDANSVVKVWGADVSKEKLKKSGTLSPKEIYKDKELRRVYTAAINHIYLNGNKSEKDAYDNATRKIIGNNASRDEIEDYVGGLFGVKKMNKLLEDTEFRKVVEAHIDKFDPERTLKNATGREIYKNKAFSDDYLDAIIKVTEEKKDVLNKAMDSYFEKEFYDSRRGFNNDRSDVKEYLEEYIEMSKHVTFADLKAWGWDIFGEYFFNFLDSPDKDFRKAVEAEVEKNKEIKHSAKGSEWEDHKYVKKIDGVYYYPVGYEDGRTIDSLKSEKDKSDSEKSDKKDSNDKSSQIEEVKKHFDQYLAKRGIDWRTLPKDEVDQMQRDIVKQLESGKEAGTFEKSVEELAKDVASGKLGNGDDRKALLGEKYEEVQKKVNNLLKGFSGDKKVSEETVSEEVKETVKKSTSKVSETKVHSGVKLSEVLSVYDKKK